MEKTNNDTDKIGFLLKKCEKELPSCFQNYQKLVDFLNPEIKMERTDKIFLEIIANLEEHDNDYYKEHFNNFDTNQIRFIYSIFSMICHMYKVKANTNVLPKTIGIIWKFSAASLGLPLVLTHASVDLFNWSPIDPTKEICLDNMKCNFLMTMTKDEEWFYLIMIEIERLGENIFNEVSHNFDKDNLLKIVNESLKKMIIVIQRIEEKCDPKVFFNVLRPYLSGSEDIPLFIDSNFFTSKLTKCFSFLEKNTQYPFLRCLCGKKGYRFRGGSAAQSSIIQLIDIILQTSEHYPEHALEFLKDMRNYMPIEDRNFLINAEFIFKNIKYDNKKLYIECLENLIKFRQAHFRIIHTYILSFTNINNAEEKGTGGTNIKDFITSIFEKNIALKNNFENALNDAK